MRIFLGFIFLCFTTTFLTSQNLDNYQLVQSSGVIPVDFAKPSSKKYIESCHYLEQLPNQKISDLQKDFYLESIYSVDELLKSGNVLFNDPITTYINAVADVLLENHKALRGQLRFYAVRSADVNAFASNDGIIFVNIGLMAHLKNEAQLAFVLAHEITHYVEKHALKLFLDTNNAMNCCYSNSFNDVKHIKKSQPNNAYSKALEMEADKGGIKLFLESGYTIKAVEAIFDVLGYAHLPYENLYFNKAFFESETFKIPSSYLSAVNTSVQPSILAFADQGMHPSLSDRKNLILKLKKEHNATATDGLLYKISKKEFLHIREIAQFELSYYFLKKHDYYNAIYNSYILLNKYPDNFYLEKMIAKALYGLTKFRNYDKWKKVYTSEKHQQGEIQRLYALLNHLKDDELNVLALSYAWRIKQMNPQDEEINQVANHLFQEMVDHHYDSEQDFYVMSPMKSLNTPGYVVKGRVEKVAVKTTPKAEKTIEVSTKDFIKYAFIDFMNDGDFLTQFKTCKKEKQRKQKRADYYQQNQDKLSLRKEQKNPKLGLSKVVIVNPSYAKFVVNGKEKKNLYQESEKAQQNLCRKIEKTAEKQGLMTTILDVNTINRRDASKFNDITTLNDWFQQQMDFEELKMSGYRQSAINQIATKYKTDYFVWIGVVYTDDKNAYAPEKLYKTAPATVNHEEETLFYIMVFDVKKAKLELATINHFAESDSKKLIKRHLETAFANIKESE